MISGIFVSGNVGYGLYYFQQENSDWYAAILNEMDKRLAGKAQLYSLVAPINGGVLLSDSLQKELHISDRREAIRYIYSRMAADINGVEVFDALREHVNEYIYFHTDHHWTALGAYYATQYAKAAGLTPTCWIGLSRWNSRTFGGPIIQSAVSLRWGPILIR